MTARLMSWTRMTEGAVMELWHSGDPGSGPPL